MRIDIKYAATTTIKEEVLKEMLPYLTKHFANASSIYIEGRKRALVLKYHNV